MPQFTFDLRKIFRCAIDLGKVISGESGDPHERAHGDEAERLIRELNPREAAFPYSGRVRHIEQYWKGPSAPPKPSWFDELRLSTDLFSEDARQALQTIGLGVACLRGTRQTEGKEWLEAGARHLWVGMTNDDRKSSKSEYARAVCLWRWPGKIVVFDGPQPELESLRDFVFEDWSVGMTEEERAAWGRIQFVPEHQKRNHRMILEEARRTLPLRAPVGTTAELAKVYDSVADSLMSCCELKYRLAVSIIDTPHHMAAVRQKLLDALTTYDSLERVLLRGGVEGGFRIAIRIIRTFEHILNRSNSVITDVYCVPHFRPYRIFEQMRIEVARADTVREGCAENHVPLPASPVVVAVAAQSSIAGIPSSATAPQAQGSCEKSGQTSPDPVPVMIPKPITPATKTPKKRPPPSEEKQQRILSTIRTAGKRLTSSKILDLWKVPRKKGKQRATAIRRDLAWMVKSGILDNLKNKGYWQ